MLLLFHMTASGLAPIWVRGGEAFLRVSWRVPNGPIHRRTCAKDAIRIKHVLDEYIYIYIPSGAQKKQQEKGASRAETTRTPPTTKRQRMLNTFFSVVRIVVDPHFGCLKSIFLASAVG